MPSLPPTPRRRPRHLLTLALALAVGWGAAPALAQADGWLDLPLTDAATGEPFALRDLDGSVVLVETMATWCGNCRRQLGHLREAAAVLGGEAAPGVAVVYLVISVERGLDPGALVAYAEREGFEFRLVVADDALLRALADRFGRAVLSPASTPHLVVARDGSVGPLTTGFTSPATLVAWLQAAAR